MKIGPGSGFKSGFCGNTKSEKPSVMVSCSDMDRVVEKNNYTNQLLHVVSRQIEDTKDKSIFTQKPTWSKPSTSQTIDPNPIFKLTEFSRDKFQKFKDSFDISGNVLDKINEQLANFNISRKMIPKQKNPLLLFKKKKPFSKSFPMTDSTTRRTIINVLLSLISSMKKMLSSLLPPTKEEASLNGLLMA
ncbi:hypothetical protein H5410_060416 [Solanum commersonii]|uniref:Uncharacterized protein n=1 Tax=Solanum commersonii TaxID=4109 RepID=A0A9J5W555_SOLCO|nr:hypothetical protein H5410_060416 [Solanum commersonii]